MILLDVLDCRRIEEEPGYPPLCFAYLDMLHDTSNSTCPRQKLPTLTRTEIQILDGFDIYRGG